MLFYNILYLVVFLLSSSSFLSSYVRWRLLLSIDAAHPRRRTETEASTRTEQGGCFEMSDEAKGTCKHAEKGWCPIYFLEGDCSVVRKYFSNIYLANEALLAAGDLLLATSTSVAENKIVTV